MEGAADYSYLLEMLDAEYNIDVFTSNYSLDDFLRVSMDYQQEDHWFSSAAEACLIFFFVVFIVLGLVGNGLVCFIIIGNGWRQSSRNWYILNLALSDILTCVLCKPLTLVRLVLKNWPLGSVLCKLVPSLQTVYVFVSTLTLVALAVDRYRSVMSTGHFRHRVLWATPCPCLAVIWGASVSIALPIFLVHRLQEVKGFGGYVLYTVCLEQWQSQSSLTVYTVFVLLLQYLSPLAAIVTLHLLIGKFLRMRIVAGGSSSRMADTQWRRKRKRHRKNMMMLSSMAVAFAVTWLPLHLVNALASFDYHMFEHTNFPLIHASSMLIAFSSVCLNPVIYGLLNSNFRRDLRRLLCRLPSSGGGGFRSGGATSCTFSGIYRRQSGGSTRATERCGLISSSVAAGLPELSQSAILSVMRERDAITAV
ncbi:QRFP-like peptide receptor [Babylonia areolata]|uniref:QRFP-like peptide receptor n=1 Tax=Babylonia areolata TaxID=304850 RepID=UPI003FD5247C